MKIIFLDIDGVLRSLASITVLGGNNKGFDLTAVALIKKLCEEAPCKIILSSSWRTGDLRKTHAQFKGTPAECLVEHIIDETPDFADDRDVDICQIRGREIDHAIVCGGISRGDYIIVDDENQMLPHQTCIFTDYNDGFLLRHFVRCMGYFNRSHPLATLANTESFI